MERKNRNSSVELLRIICAIGIVVLHYNNENLGGAFQYVETESMKEKWLYLSESICIMAVNVFVLISGYYSARKSKGNTEKIFDLLVQTGIFIEIFYLLDVFCGGQKLTIRGVLLHLFPNYYFVILFSALSLLAPYINIGLRQIGKSRAGLKAFMILSFILFSVEPFFVDCFIGITDASFSKLSSVSASGSQAGYTIINFLHALYYRSYF